MGEIKTVADGFDAFVGLLMSETDQTQDKINAFLQQLKDNKVFPDRVSYTRLKQRIEKAAARASLTKSDALITELDDEFRNLSAYY